MNQIETTVEHPAPPQSADAAAERTAFSARAALAALCELLNTDPTVHPVTPGVLPDGMPGIALRLAALNPDASGGMLRGRAELHGRSADPAALTEFISATAAKLPTSATVSGLRFASLTAAEPTLFTADEACEAKLSLAFSVDLAHAAFTGSTGEEATRAHFDAICGATALRLFTAYVRSRGIFDQGFALVNRPLRAGEFGLSITLAAALPRFDNARRGYELSFSARSREYWKLYVQLEQLINLVPLCNAATGGMIFSLTAGSETLRFTRESFYGCEVAAGNGTLQLTVDTAASSCSPADRPADESSDRNAGAIDLPQLERALTAYLSTRLNLAVDREIARGNRVMLPEAASLTVQFGSMKPLNAPAGNELEFTLRLYHRDRDALLRRLTAIDALFPAYRLTVTAGTDAFTLSAVVKRFGELCENRERGLPGWQAEFFLTVIC